MGGAELGLAGWPDWFGFGWGRFPNFKVDLLSEFVELHHRAVMVAPLGSDSLGFHACAFRPKVFGRLLVNALPFE